MNTKMIRWRFDHPDHKTRYETPVQKLDETVYRLKQELKLPLRTNIIRDSYVDQHPNAHSSHHPSDATTPVRESPKPRKPHIRKAVAMRNLHEFLGKLDDVVADPASILADPDSSTGSSLPGHDPAPTN